MASPDKLAFDIPAYQWYPRAFWASLRVRRMDALKRDAYRTFLDYAWLDDGLTQARIDQLIEVLELDPASCTLVVASCFELGPVSGRYRNDRQEQERMGKAAYRELQRQRALDREKAKRDQLAAPSSSEVQLAPVSTLLISSPLSSAKNKKRRPGAPWQEILERPEYGPLRDSKPFMLAWAKWIENCETAGKKASVPSGAQAAELFNSATRDIPKYLLAISQAIGGDYRMPNPDWVKASGFSPNGNGHSPHEIEISKARERAGSRDQYTSDLGKKQLKELGIDE